MQRIRPSFLAALALALLANPARAAQTSEDLHAEICASDGIVSKNKLLVHLLRTNPGVMEGILLYPPKGYRESGLSLVRELLSKPNACDRRHSCGKQADAAMRTLRIDFDSFLSAGLRNHTYAGLASETPASTYFEGGDSEHALRCTQNADAVGAPDKPKDTSKLRIRGKAGDLVYDRNDKKNFKSTSAAKVSYTDDRSGGPRKYTTKVQAVIGYVLNEENTSVSQSQFIPYVSVNQTINNVEGSSTSLDASNYVAGGTILNWNYTPNEVIGHQFSAAPQFLYNSKDTSEIVSGRLTYAPWTYFTKSESGLPLDINTANVSDQPHSLLKLLFDLRADNGYYTRKGNIADPTLHSAFARVGSQFGFSWSILDYGLTLKATETLLYGYIGTKRKLDFFDGSVSYDLDPNGYFSLAFEYQKGRDEDTTDAVQTWTIGLTGKY